MGGGFPGMGGMGNMQDVLLQVLMSDPELSAGMQNPKIMRAFQSMMGGGGTMDSSMNDPEVKSFMAKMQQKMGPLMGMMGGGGGGNGMGFQQAGRNGGADEQEDEDDEDDDFAEVEEVD